MGNQVAAAVVHGTVTKTTRLPNNASIFRAELCAISLALAVIRRRKEKNVIIFSDSMSSLEAISGFKLEIDIVQNIIKDYTHLARPETSQTILQLKGLPKARKVHSLRSTLHYPNLNRNPNSNLKPSKPY